MENALSRRGYKVVQAYDGEDLVPLPRPSVAPALFLFPLLSPLSSLFSVSVSLSLSPVAAERARRMRRRTGYAARPKPAPGAPSAGFMRVPVTS